MAMTKQSITPQPPDKKINGRALSLTDQSLRRVTAKSWAVSMPDKKPFLVKTSPSTPHTVRCRPFK